MCWQMMCWNCNCTNSQARLLADFFEINESENPLIETLCNYISRDLNHTFAYLIT